MNKNENTFEHTKSCYIIVVSFLPVDKSKLHLIVMLSKKDVDLISSRYIHVPVLCTMGMFRRVKDVLLLFILICLDSQRKAYFKNDYEHVNGKLP